MYYSYYLEYYLGGTSRRPKRKCDSFTFNIYIPNGHQAVPWEIANFLK